MSEVVVGYEASAERRRPKIVEFARNIGTFLRHSETVAVQDPGLTLGVPISSWRYGDVMLSEFPSGLEPRMRTLYNHYFRRQIDYFPVLFPGNEVDGVVYERQRETYAAIADAILLGKVENEDSLGKMIDDYNRTTYLELPFLALDVTIPRIERPDDVLVPATFSD